MQGNYCTNTYPNQYTTYPQQGPNAVSINIMAPQAYSGMPCVQQVPSGFYSMYGANSQPQLPSYPQNYNNIINQNRSPLDNKRALASDTDLKEKTPVPEIKEGKTEDKTEKKDDEKDKKKLITPLTDDYIKSLENYLNNDNPKIRLIGAKELMERFKEDENRKDNPSLIPLLNKTLQDTSAAVRFLGLTTLQLGYSVGDDETISILKELQSTNKDKFGEDALLSSEILLKLSAAPKVEAGNKQ